MRSAPQARTRILDIVRRDPGLHKSALCRASGMGWGAVSHHLGVLEGEGLVQFHAMGRETLVFPAAVPERQVRWLGVLRQSVGPALAASLRKRPGATVRELSRRLRASRKIIRRQLAMLQEAGLVRVRQGRVLRHALARRLLRLRERHRPSPI